MKKTLFIIATLITLLLTGCNKEYKPLYEYADKMGVELDAFSIVKKRDYCDIDSIRYYDNLLLKKSNELAGKVKANPYISNDSISKYNILQHALQQQKYVYQRVKTIFDISEQSMAVV